MQIFDITVSLSPDLPQFPGDPPVEVDQVMWLGRGDTANLSRLAFGSHAGTHIDAPRHFHDRGATVDDIPLPLLTGAALVADCRGCGLIGPEELARLNLDGVERLLLRTDNSRLWQRREFSGEYTALSKSGAEYLLGTDVLLVGIDYLSIEPYDGDGTVHRLLLGKNLVILEGVNLEGIEAGTYELLCLPLKTVAADGAPVRALLRR
jgi:arylformamidase